MKAKLNFLMRLEQGACPPNARPFIYGGALTPIEKPNGGIRPIVVGNIFVKCVGKALASALAGRFRDELQPKGQFGVATSNGGEAITHALRVGLAANEGWISLQLDFRNAFNEIKRDLI